MKQVEERHEAICLQHVVLVFSHCAEDRDDLDAPLDGLAQLLDLLLLTNEYPLANVDQRRYEA